MIEGFHHTGIVVRDLEEMVRFYTRVLGLQILRRIDSVAPPEGDHTGIPGARRQLAFEVIEDEVLELLTRDHGRHVPEHQALHPPPQAERPRAAHSASPRSSGSRIFFNAERARCRRTFTLASLIPNIPATSDVVSSSMSRNCKMIR